MHNFKWLDKIKRRIFNDTRKLYVFQISASIKFLANLATMLIYSCLSTVVLCYNDRVQKLQKRPATLYMPSLIGYFCLFVSLSFNIYLAHCLLKALDKDKMSNVHIFILYITWFFIALRIYCNLYGSFTSKFSILVYLHLFFGNY